jgi:rSAM/selenodomain-associated transferase 2
VISVIVPVCGEDPRVAGRFAGLAVEGQTELLVADAGAAPETSIAFERIGARVLSGGGSRGARLARAVRESRGEILFFLHADSHPPEGALEAIRRTLAGGAVAGAFSLAYEDADAGLRWVAWWANRRSRWLKLPFGDQGLFCRRDAYDRAGGFADLPICDDLDLVRRLKRVGRLAIRREQTLTSPRRYRTRGTLRQVLRTWRVLAGYFAGVDPERLERWYNR